MSDTPRAERLRERLKAMAGRVAEIEPMSGAFALAAVIIAIVAAIISDAVLMGIAAVCAVLAANSLLWWRELRLLQHRIDTLESTLEAARAASPTETP